MKTARCIALIAAMLSAPIVFAQDIVVAEIDGEAFTLADFEREYAKTVGSAEIASKDSLPEYTDFLRRYVNFLVKLKEAEAAGYFDHPDIQAEINEYRASFAKPYLLDNEIVTPLVEDLYEKRKEFVHASHIMTAIIQEGSPADTLRAWSKIMALQDSLAQGVPFGDLAFRQSEDRAASSEGSRRGFRGNLGTFSAGDMIKSFEDAAYNTPVGEISDVVRSAYGYHLIKVHAREDAKPDYHVSHIMVRFLGDTSADSAKVHAKIDSLKALIDEGASFDEMARAHSEDRSSAQHGGYLGGAIRYKAPDFDKDFHDAAFALEEIGQISDVVETPFGLHIIRLDNVDSLGTLDEMYDELARLARNLPRMREAETALARSSRELYTVSVDTLLLSRLLGGIQRDSVQQYLGELAAIDSVGAMPLITLADSSYTLKQFASFAAQQTNAVGYGPTAVMQSLIYTDAFLNDKALAYRSFELEKSDQGFREIMQNFEEGLTIFKIMEDSVWNASSADTLRLLNHYNANIERYQWPDRYRLLEISGAVDSVLIVTVDWLDQGRTWADLVEKIAADSTLNLQLDTVLVPGYTNSVYDRALTLSKGEHTGILSAHNRRLVLYMDGGEPPRSKTFEEARTEVMADIQVEIEQNLHMRLRSKYRVKTFPDRLTTAYQH
jgi:peptidyl-prolyl cis-trans isomerase SurA